jgi:hypothetical protein
MRLEGVIILIFNIFVLLVLAFQRGKFPPTYWTQIICLAFNDFIAGIAVFLSSFIDSLPIRENIATCGLTVVFLFGSQNASLYNIFGISIFRFIVLRRADTGTRLWQKRHTVFATLFSWTLSVVLCTLPIVLYNKSAEYSATKYCSVQHIFQEDLKQGMLIMMGSFIVPLLFTNILYLTLFYSLKSKWKRVTPVTEAASSVVSCPAPQTLAVTEQIDATRRNTSAQSASCAGQYSLTNMKPKGYAQCLDSRTSEGHVLSIRSVRQRRVFKLLGVILILLNICSWPSIITMLYTSQVNKSSLKRDNLMLLFTSICFNSVLNPILYTATIPEFRSFILDKLFKIKSLFTC